MGFKMRRLYPKQGAKKIPERVVSSMALNYIWWWGSSSGVLRKLFLFPHKCQPRKNKV